MDLWVASGVLGAVLAAALIGVLVLSRRSRGLRADFARSQQELVELSRSVERLTQDLAARPVTTAPPPEPREYVITTLGDAEPALPAAPATMHLRLRPPPSAMVQDRFVALLSRYELASGTKSVAVEAMVRSVAFGHGVRRALSSDVLDRAAAEAHIARRRSRRERKQELREAKRLARELRSQRTARGDAA